MKNDQTNVLKSSTNVKKAVKTVDSKKTAAADKTKKANKFSKFFKDLKSEVKKIVWPTQKQVVNNTSVVLIAMLASGLFIWGIDTLLMKVFNVILNK